MIKKLILIIVALFLMFLCFYFIRNYNSKNNYIGKENRDMTKLNTEQECINSGGKWEKGGLVGTLECVHTYSDGGIKCTNSRECIGSCITTNGKESFCQYTNSHFGCYNTIENYNKNQSILCYD